MSRAIATIIAINQVAEVRSCVSVPRFKKQKRREKKESIRRNKINTRIVIFLKRKREKNIPFFLNTFIGRKVNAEVIK